MSYDLFFYKKADDPITENQFADHLNKNLQLNVSQHPRQWLYEHPDTCVFFAIDWNEEDPETAKDFDIFKGFKYLNFAFNINFMRPEFFGVEAFPVLEELLAGLDIWILNPQDEVEQERLTKIDGHYLMNQWVYQNNRAVLGHFSQLNLNYLPLELSNSIWSYHYGRQDLQARLGDNVFVPRYFLLKNKDDHQLYTACVWTHHIAMILPPVDYVLVQKKYKRWFRTIEESGLVPYWQIIDQFGAVFEPFEHEVRGLKILRPLNAEKIQKQFNTLELGSTVQEFGEVVSMDLFVNVRLGM